MARYIDAEMALKIIDSYAKTVSADGKVVVDAIRDIVGVITPTADVVPKSEEEKPMFENTKHILLYLKRDIHNKATYPETQGISPYISLKVFDAILQGYLNNLK